MSSSTQRDQNYLRMAIDDFYTSKRHHSGSTNPKKRYDVYLSYSASDAGSFTSNLYTAISTIRGVHVFWDEERLGTGDRASPHSVLDVIEESRLVIIVFSRHYVNSIWCLCELEKITECCRMGNLRVVPLFYDLHPLDKSKRGGMFGNAFHGFVLRLISMKKTWRNEDKFMSWVAAICKASTISGFVVHNYRNEMELIKNVVEHIANVLEKKNVFVADYPKGVMRSRVQDVIELLKKSEDPLLLGVWGMAGIGKTVIARAIYDQLGHYFEDKSFLDDVGKVWEQHGSAVSLQKQLLFDITKATKIKIPTIEAGKVILKERLRQHRMVLLILEDVTKLEQLNALCGSREWFGKGSKIIITTRNKLLLKEHGVEHIYGVEELDQSESLEVFGLHTTDHVNPMDGLYTKMHGSPKDDFDELSRLLVAYSGGLHLALQVLGSNLRRQPVHQWMDVLRSPEKLPISKVQNSLETSFSKDLNDKEKEIFLDIACFFVGKDRYARCARNCSHEENSGSRECAILQIRFLQYKSYVTIDKNNKLGVHVLLQGMARDIITRESMNKPEPKTFDVFLSFKGEDSRPKFISHLYSSLQNAGIYVFRDDDGIERGDQISFSLLQAIGRSRICIVVLSTNYANSRWCMLELEKIMEIGRIKGLVVMPVFYEVDPSEVRKQTGQFGKAFEDLMSRISVDEYTERKWRRVLSGIGGIAGCVIIDSRNESEDIENIVGHVTRLLDRTELFVAEHPVGVESRVQVVTKLLNIQRSEDVLLLGIWGMGGIGKTTVAKAIYNQIGREFEGRSFLLNIREDWEKDKRASLQQQVLCDIYKKTALKIHDIESGKNILKERLTHKRVLIVLDDVDDLDQLKALCGSREWFGPGSRIIITTRDMHLLKLCGVNLVYKVEEMDESESLELFSWHAFKQASPRDEFATHSIDMIAYSGRLPLALEVLGSYLFDRGIMEWQRVLEKLKSIPHHQVQKKLKISFDGLSDDTEKQVFLDIACFFIGMDRNDVIQILNGCQFFADTGLNVLLERSLVTLDNKNKLRMHDLLRDMGREIIREESPYDPEKRSRLWLHEEVLDVLSKHTGTENVKGLALVELPGRSTICLNTEAFVKMNKLRLLQLSGVQLNGDFKNLSGDLRWMYWHGFPSTYTPAKFQQRSLVAIELKYSNLKQTWKKSRMLENLKILNLSHSLDLVRTPDFSYLPNLEKLVLKDCPSLSTVSDTIGSLHKLLLVNLTNCTGLRKLPRSMYRIKSLETLILSGCSMVNKLEEDLEQMESLTTLIADRTAITKVPFSIVRSKSIGYISLCGFEGFSRDVFPSLIRSWMAPTNNVISLVQTSASVSSLASLDFTYGSSYSLPSAFKDLLTLRSLRVECGSELALTQEVARILDVLKAPNFPKFEAKATTSQISHTDASPLIGSPSPVCILGSKSYSKSLLIQMGMKCHVPYIAKDSISQTKDGAGDSFLLPRDDNSVWLPFRDRGCSVIFEVPEMEGGNLKRMMLNIVYSSSMDNIASEGCHGVLIMNYTKATIQVYKKDTLTSFEDEEWQSITSNLDVCNKVEVMVVFGEGFIVEKTTVYLLYDKPINKEMENCHAVDEENVNVSGSNSIDVPAETKVTASGADDMPAEMNVTASGADDMAAKKKCCFWWRCCAGI